MKLVQTGKVWQPSPIEPLGGVRVTMKKIKKLDIAPVEVRVDQIRRFLKASKKDLRNGEGWELIKKDYKGVALYREVWPKTTPVNYRTSLLNYFLETVPPSWYDVFHSAYQALQQISNGIHNAVVIDKQRLVPPMQSILNPFGYCPFGRVKVIIIGQGPYPWIDDDGPVANGLCFSTNKGRRVERSLQMIYRELERCYGEWLEDDKLPFVMPKHGDLRPWAKEGVLLLNSTLTGEGRPRGAKAKEKGEAHQGYWNSFIHLVIRSLTQHHKNLIFMAWGRDAQATLQNIGIIGKHIILKCAHPVGDRGNAKEKFYGCGHFTEANRLLIEMGKKPINWHSIMTS